MAKKMHDLDKKLFDLAKLKAEVKFKVKLNKKQLEKFVSKYSVFPSVTLLEKDFVAYIAKLGLKEGSVAKEEEAEPKVNPLVKEALELGIKTIPTKDSVVTVHNATDEQLTAAINKFKEENKDLKPATKVEKKSKKSLKDMNKDELKILAKDKGIKSWHLKTAETLREELKALDKKE